jgi:hypothetical protein
MARTLALTALLVSVAASGAAADYCPLASDLIIAYTTPGSKNQVVDGGWINKGGGVRHLE